MCGIVGYVGKKQVVPIILDGLRRLEYRGYDSARASRLRVTEKASRSAALKGNYATSKT
jgi:glucosamine 6-phosphate synthetase-like amidotransferase/phosphosugar isomerase protein